MESNPCLVIPSKYFLIHKTVLEDGTFGNKPRENSECKIAIANVSVEGIDLSLSSVPASFSEYLHPKFSGILRIGSSDTFVDKGLEACIQTMHPNEKSMFTLFFPRDIKPVIVASPPADAMIVKCSISLETFTHLYEIFEMTDVQLYDEATNHKKHGVQLFKDGRIVDAFLRFSKAFRLFRFISDSKENVSKTDYVELGVSVLNDMALCQFKLGNFDHSVSLCSKVLSKHSENEKALYRRALSYMELKNYDSAEEDLCKLMKIHPGVQYVIDKFKELKTITKEADHKYASVVKKMFA